MEDRPVTTVRVTKHGKVDKFAAYGVRMLEMHGFVDVWGEGKTVGKAVSVAEAIKRLAPSDPEQANSIAYTDATPPLPSITIRLSTPPTD